MNDKELTQAESQAVALPDDEKKGGVLRGAKDFLENTFSNLKGKDISQAVEEFTSEMTLVAEGLSEDQEKLRQDLTRVDTQLTLLEEKTAAKEKTVAEDASALRSEVQKLQQRVAELEDFRKKSAEAKKTAQADKKGIHAILRQVTVIVGLVCVAWVVTAVIRLIGG